MRETDASGRVVIACRWCGERMILLGHPDDWYREGRTAFECECGRELTLADRVGGVELELPYTTRPPH